MSYTAWSVVFGEQPTAAKWNQLGANDAGFKDGTNIDNLAILTRHIADANITPAKITNAYKFFAYPSSTVAISSATQKVALNTELYDSNSNFDTSTNRYTAPVNGFYHFDAQARLGSTGMGTTENASIGIYKNGSQLLVSEKNNGSGDANRLVTPHIGATIQLTAGDYIELYALMGGVYRDIVSGPIVTFMCGHLVTPT